MKAKEEEKEEFYEQLQATFNKAPRRDMKIVMGEINAEVGMENADGRTQNQNDHITIGREWMRSLNDVRAKRGADAASDHQLVIAVLKLKLKAYRDQADRPAHKFNVQYLKNKAKAEKYKVELKNRFDVLSELDEETVENYWQEIKKTWSSACQKVLGKRTRELKEWISADSWHLIKERKEAKQKINHTQDQVRKEELQDQYREVNQKVKRSTKQDKKNFIHELTEEAETAAGKGDTKRLYDITRTLSGKNRNTSCPIKDKERKAITCDAKQRERWAEHFKKILNRPPPPEPPEIPDASETLEVNMNPPTKAEIRKAIKTMKSGKAAGPDGILPEALKDDINTSTDMLQPFLQKVWENEDANGTEEGIPCKTT
ncbi:hypothetical protein EGW08_023107 [Elysia chlorotica]|uniref:Endonuclease/exonuclease/phosphatase domain-containing protein n=1 Tax=Elysia chlorotica TaxID=188477 RepID=A0A433SJC9_ELYCH|nr:hypothetical protein EGW08_023107 [Elysia chlorotica]